MVPRLPADVPRTGPSVRLAQPQALSRALSRGVSWGPLSRALGCPAAAEKAYPVTWSCHGVPEGWGGAPRWVSGQQSRLGRSLQL